MSEIKHTPGPWHRDVHSGLDCDVRAENKRPVALCYGLGEPRKKKGESGEDYSVRWERYRKESHANARLIAAAPDLLAACEAALLAIDNYPDRQHPMTASEIIIRRAIAKATGQ